MPHVFNFFQRRLDDLRESLAKVDALPQLSVIALIIGTFTALIIVGFRLALELPHLLFPMDNAEAFEVLAPHHRVLIILGSSAIIALALLLLNKYQRQMSVSHVIDRLHNHQGKMPATNAIAQFLLAVTAIGGGHSVGREGPAVHLGASAASQIGNWMRLPNNSMQIIIACGVAAGISTSFDTPLAGVIFAMEVIVMEYSIIGFVPVILASVIGAAISKALLGEAIAFNVTNISLGGLHELLFIVIAGLLIAVFAGIYIRLHIFTALKTARLHLAMKIALAGLLTASAAYFVPQIMGLGYDTIQSAIEGKLLIGTLLAAGLAKLLLTPVVTALGIPGGVIGPSLFIGACLGGLLGGLVNQLFPQSEITPSLYVLLGMTGMMAAVLNAPLAALIAVLELSHNPEIIFPAMLMIVVACITTRLLFNVRGIFLEQLAITGRDIEMGPAIRALNRVGVMSAMNRKFIVTDEQLNKAEVNYVLSTQPDWVIFSHGERLMALWAADLAHFLDHIPEKVQKGVEQIQLHEVPGKRHMLQAISQTSTLYDGLKELKKSQCEVLYITSNAYSHRNIHGILTLEAIQNHYQPNPVTIV